LLHAVIMRLAPLLLGLLAVLPVACGGEVGGTGDGDGQHEATGDAGTDSSTGASDAIVGRVYATTATAASDRFDVELQPVPAVNEFCAGATTTVGSCCYFAPTPPPPDPVPGTGTPATEASAGTITLLDDTSNTSIGTFSYAGGGYVSVPMDASDLWQPGDQLTVSAAGAQIGAFTVSAPALIPPSVQAPSSFAAAEGVQVTWQPDPNADTMSITIDDEDGGIVACSAPDAQGALTMDASLFASFRPGDRCEGSANRETVRYAQTPTGRVAFVTMGWATFEASVQVGDGRHGNRHVR
jgi:hypothetical protein